MEDLQGLRQQVPLQLRRTTLGPWERSATSSAGEGRSTFHDFTNFYGVEVSENGGTPQIIHAHRIFHYKQSILGYPHFRKTPFALISWSMCFQATWEKGKQKGLLHAIPTVDFMWLKRLKICGTIKLWSVQRNACACNKRVPASFQNVLEVQRYQ